MCATHSSQTTTEISKICQIPPRVGPYLILALQNCLNKQAKQQKLFQTYLLHTNKQGLGNKGKSKTRK